jgi:NhaA family Na+:H+ antiporter
VIARVARVVRIPWFILTSLFVLPFGCVVALVWANVDPTSYFQTAHALKFAVNDIGIAFFLGIMTTHVVEETLAGGVLHSWRRGALPIVAALGGVIVPIGIYLWVLTWLGEPMLMSAWITVCAVDVAIAFLAGNLIFGRRAALPFLVLLALASNTFGLAAVAILNPTSAIHALIGVAILALSMVLALWLRRRHTRSFWPYVLGPGVLSWTGLFLSGVPPALALVAVVPFMPHARRDPGLLAEPAPADHTTLSQFARFWGPPGQVVLFLVGLVDAGVPLHGLEAGMWALPIAVIIGRPIGVLASTELGIACGLHRTQDVAWRQLLVIGLIASTGLTMALFFATTAFSTGPLLLQSETGALLAVAGVVLAGPIALALGATGRTRTQSTGGER